MRRSSEREAASSNSGWTNTQGLYLNDGGENVAFVNTCHKRLDFLVFFDKGDKP